MAEPQPRPSRRVSENRAPPPRAPAPDAPGTRAGGAAHTRETPERVVDRSVEDVERCDEAD